MTRSVLDQYLTDPEELRLLQRDRLIVAVTELICKKMAEQGIKKSDLAAALNKSRSFVSQCLDGEKNLTLATIADIFTALGLTMKVNAEPLVPQASAMTGPMLARMYVTQECENSEHEVDHQTNDSSHAAE